MVVRVNRSTLPKHGISKAQLLELLTPTYSHFTANSLPYNSDEDARIG